MVTCRQIADSASDYVDRCIPFQERMSVKLHLMGCKHCNAYTDQFATTVSVLRGSRGVESDPIDDETHDRLLEIFRKHRPPPRPVPWFDRHPSGDGL